MRPNLSASSIAAALASLAVTGTVALACGGSQPAAVDAKETAPVGSSPAGQGSCSSNASCGASAHKNAPAGHASCSAAAHCGATAHGDAGK